MQFATILVGIFIMLTYQNCASCKEAQVFPNALFNEADIMDFIEQDLFFEILHPKDLQYTYRLRKAKNFGSSFTHPFNAVRLVVADPVDCCSYPYNAEHLKDAVALCLRGDCSFVSKAVKIEKTGAVAVIIMDNNVENDSKYIEMADDDSNRQPNVPAFFLLGSSGYVIRKKLEDLHLDAALINIPVNMSSTAIHKLNQPPWILW